jgi:hypothetical protein
MTGAIPNNSMLSYSDTWFHSALIPIPQLSLHIYVRLLLLRGLPL